MGAPTDCPECGKPSLRAGECPCGFVVPPVLPEWATDDDTKAVGRRGVEAARRELEKNAETETNFTEGGRRMGADSWPDGAE